MGRIILERGSFNFRLWPPTSISMAILPSSASLVTAKLIPCRCRCRHQFELKVFCSACRVVNTTATRWCQQSPSLPASAGSSVNEYQRDYQCQRHTKVNALWQHRHYSSTCAVPVSKAKQRSIPVATQVVMPPVAEPFVVY